jgi:hypothetical protein
MNYKPKNIIGAPRPKILQTVEPYKQDDTTQVFSIANSTVQVVRLSWSELLSSDYLKDSKNPGVYAIVSTSKKPDVNVEVYVGSSGSVGGRVRSHNSDKRHKGGQMVFVITSTSLEVNATHCRRFEGILCRLTAKQPGVDVISEDEAAFDMSSYDKAVMTSFVPTAIDLLAAAGYPLNDYPNLIVKDVEFLDDHQVIKVLEPAGDGAALSMLEPELWEFAAPEGCLADYTMSGAMTTTGRFVLFPGSEFRMSGTHTLPDDVEVVRQFALANGYLEDYEAEDGRLRLVFPLEVKSPKHAIYVMMKANRAVVDHWTCSSVEGGEV